MLKGCWDKTQLLVHIRLEGDGQKSRTQFSFCCLQFEYYYPIPTACNLPHVQCNRRRISAVLAEPFSKFQRDI